MLRRSDGVEVATAGRVGTNLGQFMNLHNLAIDSKGNVYSAEVQGKRVQRFPQPQRPVTLVGSVPALPASVGVNELWTGIAHN